MNREEILLAILTLSRSQGSYGRLYKKLTDNSPESEEALEELVEQKFSSIVDLVFFIEG